MDKADILNKTEVDQLVRFIIHDLEKPMAVNERILTRILNGSLDTAKEPHRRLIGAAVQASSRLRRMLEDLNQIIQGHKPDIKNQPIKLCQFIDNLTQEFIPLAESENIKLISECEADHNFFSDLDLLHRIVENYLYNAFNHNSSSTGYVKLNATIDHQTNDHQTKILIRVENSGLSIPQEHLEDIFKAGVQLTLRAGKIWRGDGLGLAFCRFASFAIGGKVWAENLPDRSGVAFCLTI
ncbi:MAG: HAMP domain-containing histidine kinase [Desulfamplus sp.]|nr:HAMP domain-containing histidine kinase [Desulfamplus sp.]